GSIRLIHSLSDLSNTSYWLSIRLTRYRAHPPHSYVHIHISIREENFYLPQCVDIYQNIKIYDYLIQSTFAYIQALSFYDNIHLQYSIINNNNINENIFSINKQTGSIQLLSSIQNNHLLISNYLLTIQALDNQHQLSVDCYLEINFIRRQQQRLFQVIALLDHEVYDKNIEIRYQIIDFNQYFIINRRTGYIASKQLLHSNRTYEFNNVTEVEAFTVAHRNDIEQDEDINNEHAIHSKWRIVSFRVILPIKIHVLPMNIIDSSLLLTNESTINIDLLTTTKVGSILLQLKINNNNNNYTQWFIMIGHIDHTRYFHVNFQSGELILIRPIDELINKTTIIELHINITNDWILMNTIKVIIHIINDKRSLIYFAQTDYYISVLKNITINSKITHLTIENSFDNCTYNIHSVERIQSKDLFRIDSYTGLITNIQSLEKSMNKKHLLTIIYHCKNISHIAYTRLHINILDKEKSKNQTNNSYRFSQDNYLVIFETSFINNQKKYLIDLELINNDYYGKRIKPDAQIIEGNQKKK
ncbi:unnamed protein product, partial [Rotaria sp. Silwood2]